MGNDLERPFSKPAMTSSRASKVQNAKMVLSSTTTPADAARAATRLLGSYAHMKPADPEVFIEAVARLLHEYPLGVVRECIDPVHGIARKLKFLSIAELSDWLDERLEYYRLVAATSPRERPPQLPAPPASPEMAARVQVLLRDLGRRMAARAARGDVIMRRRRVHRYLAERRLRVDKRRALAELQANGEDPQ